MTEEIGGFRGWWMEWLMQNRRGLSTLFSVAVILLGLLFYFVQHKRHETFKDLREAREVYRAWEKSKFRDRSISGKLDQLMKKYPELQLSYGGKLAQVEGGERIALFHQKNLERSRELGSQFPYHLEYGEISELVEMKKEAEGLIRALELARQIEAVPQENLKILHAFNQLRIAMLEKRVGTGENEKKALEKLKGLDVYPILSEHFLEQGLSLDDYIASR